MSYQQGIQKAKLWAVVRGFVITAIISAALAAAWYPVTAGLIFYGSLVIVPVTGVYCVVWLLAVGFILIKDPAQYLGAALFVVMAVGGTVTFYKLDNIAKRSAELELESKLQTSREIEQPLSKSAVIALSFTESSVCRSNGICQWLLMHGLTDQVTVFRKMGGTYRDKFDDYEWKIYLIRLRDEPGCHLLREDFGKLNIVSEEQSRFRKSCFNETSFTKKGNLYELIDNAILLKTGRSDIYESIEFLPRVKTAIAKEVADGKIKSEVARWDYKRSRILGREFGTRFNRTDFVRALFGMPPIKK